MGYMHKLGVGIVFAVLLLVLVVPNVSGAESGTKSSKIYNFTDYTNNKAYNGTTNDTTTEVPVSDYYALNSSDANYQIYQTTTSGVYAYTRFEFKINENASSIAIINITWAGLGDSHASISKDGYILYVWNETGESWKQERNYYTDANEQTEHIVYTSGCSDFINSGGYLKVLARSNTTSTTKWVDIETDYIDVNVTYFKIWNVSTDKDIYSVGDTITVTWGNEGGFGATETRINIDYRNQTGNVQWCLHSYLDNTSTTDTSAPIPQGCGGQLIDIYVYTASNGFDSYTANITKGDPWPKTILNSILPEFLIIAVPLLSAVAIYFLMRRRSKKIGG
jgi:hypothetical protein